MNSIRSIGAPARVILSIGALAVAISIAGCGSDNKDSESAEVDAAGIQKTTATGTTGPTGGTLGSTVAMKLNEMNIITPTKVVKAGPVKFTAVNTGQVVHEVIVIKTDKPAGDLGSGSRVSEAGSVGEISELDPGKSGKLDVKLKAGHYALICNVPGHYAAGMYTDLTAK